MIIGNTRRGIVATSRQLSLLIAGRPETSTTRNLLRRRGFACAYGQTATIAASCIIPLPPSVVACRRAFTARSDQLGSFRTVRKKQQAADGILARLHRFANSEIRTCARDLGKEKRKKNKPSVHTHTHIHTS